MVHQSQNKNLECMTYVKDKLNDKTILNDPT
jgi:hypothetical protein